ncbi:hypothetical protein Q7M84_04860 [Candidatus Liberibacter asiaticus]
MAISYRYRYSPNFTQRRWRRRPYTSSRRARPFNTYSRMNMYRRRLQPAYGSSRIVSPYRIRFNRPYKRLPYNRRRRPYFARSRRRRPFNRWRRRPYTWRRHGLILFYVPGEKHNKSFHGYHHVCNLMKISNDFHLYQLPLF